MDGDWQSPSVRPRRHMRGALLASSSASATVAAHVSPQVFRTGRARAASGLTCGVAGCMAKTYDIAGEVVGQA